MKALSDLFFIALGLSSGINLISAFFGPSLLFHTRTRIDSLGIGLTIVNFAMIGIFVVHFIRSNLQKTTIFGEQSE